MKRTASKPSNKRTGNKFRPAGRQNGRSNGRSKPAAAASGGGGSLVKGGRVLKRRAPSSAKAGNSHGGGGGVQDARHRIQQKKRKSVTDAREILSNMAKTQDARNKLNKMRQGRTGLSPVRGGGGGGNVRQIGSHILRKTDRNGKISLVTNKTKSALDINVAIQKQLGLISAPRLPSSASSGGHGGGHGIGLKRSPMKRPSIRRESAHLLRAAAMDEAAAVAAEYGYPPSPPPPPPSRHPLSRSYETSLYKWTKQGTRGAAAAAAAASQVIGSLGAARRQALDDQLMHGDRWPQFTVTRPAREYVDLDAVMDDEEMPLVPFRQTISLQGSSRVSNVHSRLDTSPVQPESHGILAQPKTKVVVPAGHRIVVSNLQSTVSQDDIKELFEDIGQLLAARLVRPGVAEVIYKNLKDAQKAVDTYHNRQLDGQPMKCLLVNKRPLNNPTAPPIAKSETQGPPPSRKSLPTPNATSKLVPDIQTIHKVLFQRK